jgi:small subunit ribosomal protein S6
MTTTQSKSYRVTFVLDTRGSEEQPEAIISRLKETISSIGGEVLDVEDRGLLETARVSQKTGLSTGVYLRFSITAPADFSESIREKLKLDKTIDRIFTEAV